MLKFLRNTFHVSDKRLECLNMSRSVSDITPTTHQHPIFRHFAPLQNDSPGVWVWQWSEKWCKEIAIVYHRVSNDFWDMLKCFQRLNTHVCIVIINFEYPEHGENRIFEEWHYADCKRLRSQNRLIGSQWACWAGWYDVGHRPYNVCNYCGRYYAIIWLWMHHLMRLTRHIAPKGLIMMTYPLRFAFF